MIVVFLLRPGGEKRKGTKLPPAAERNNKSTIIRTPPGELPGWSEGDQYSVLHLFSVPCYPMAAVRGKASVTGARWQRVRDQKQGPGANNTTGKSIRLKTLAGHLQDKVLCIAEAKPT